MDRIIEFFNSHAEVNDEMWAYFRNHLDVNHYNTGDIIHHAHLPCSKLCFMQQGIARSYLQQLDGRDFTYFFHYDHKKCSAKQFILVDYPSFNMQTPSTYGFQALTHCQLASISHSNFMEFLLRFPEFLIVEKQLVVSAYQHNNRRLLSLLTKPAKERLEEFEKEHGELFDMIPHYHIASYLGITPQRLSQLRRE